MIYAVILFIMFSFMSYRLLGIRATVLKKIVSSMLSLFFTSAAYYALHIRHGPLKEAITQVDHYAFLYFITLIIVSLAFSLILEMMQTSGKLIEIDSSLRTTDKIRYFIATRTRYINLVYLISKNNLLRSSIQLDEAKRNEQVSLALKNTLEQAGGIFIKFGQFLSTRSDLFPEGFITELSSLQEKAPAVPVADIKTVIEDQLGKSISDAFLTFDEKPLAAASMAQVHRAQLHSGESVVVKVLRPGLKRQLIIDINILENFAELLANRAMWANKINIVNLTEGFIRSLYEEVDFNIEKKNIQEMRKKRSEAVYIPKVFERYSSTEVLTIEFLNGHSIRALAQVIKNNQRKHQLVNVVFFDMLKQIFEDGVFHGDPHPGNIFILAKEQPAFIDFGSVGKLSTIQREGFKWLMLGINRKNADSMIHGIKALVENSDEIRLQSLEQALSQFLVEHDFEGNIMSEMGQELFNMMSDFGLKFFPDVAGAFRSLITLQGSLQMIDPAFNLASVIDEYIGKVMNKRKMAAEAKEMMEDDVLNLLPRLRALPKKIDNIVEQVNEGKLTIRMSLFSDEDNVKFANDFFVLFFTGLTGFALGVLALGALFLAQAEEQAGYSFLNVFGYSGLGLSVIMLIRVAVQSLTKKH